MDTHDRDNDSRAIHSRELYPPATTPFVTFPAPVNRPCIDGK